MNYVVISRVLDSGKSQLLTFFLDLQRKRGLGRGIQVLVFKKMKRSSAIQVYMCDPHLFGDSIWFIFEFFCSYPKRWSVLVKAMPREKHLNRIYPWLLLFGLVICLKLCVLLILFLDVPLLVLKILNYFLAWPIKDLSMPTDDPINCDHFFDNWPFFRFSIYSLPGHISWYISSLSHIYYISKLWAPLKRKN